MTSSVIGALRVTLGLDSAQFDRGRRQAQSGLTDLRNSLLAVSAGMAAVGAAAFTLVRNTADIGVQVSRQAAIANTSVRDFQRMAAAAQTVGIEQGKMADILKDVNDRVGDFLSTGGGPMADFFENIAPQVGVTAENFRDLSGADALQLFVQSLQAANLSQAEMTFYLEAMASDATALVPLLANNGAELNRLGDAAEAAGAVMSEEGVANSREFSEAMVRLRESMQGLRNTVAKELMPVFTQLIDRITTDVVPMIADIIAKVADWIAAFRDLPGPVQEAIGLVAAALGVGGPVMLAIAGLSTAIKVLVAGSGPIGLFIMAASLAAAAWIKWGDDIKAAVGPVLDWMSEKLGGLIEQVGSLIDALIDLRDYSDDPAAAFGIVGRTQAQLPEQRNAGAELGQALTQGVLDGMNQTDLDAATRDWINQVPDAARDELGIQSPSRVFAEIGRFLTQGLGLGIREGAQEPVDAVTDMTTQMGIAAQQGEAALAGLAGAARTAFTGIVTGSQSVTDALGGLFDAGAQYFGNALFDTLFGSFVGIPSYAVGTDFHPGGLARVNEIGGEIMNLPSGTQVIPHDISREMARSAGAPGVAEVRVIGGNLTLSDNGQIMANVQVVANQAGQDAVQTVSTKMANDPNFGRSY